MKKDDVYRSQFRLPYDLFEKLKAESEKNHRSLNAEIVARLEKSVRDDEIENHPRAVKIPNLPERSDYLDIREHLLGAVAQLDALLKLDDEENS